MEHRKPFVPLKKRFRVLSSPPSSDDEDYPPMHSMLAQPGPVAPSSEPTFTPPPLYNQQAFELRGKLQDPQQGRPKAWAETEVHQVASGYNRTTGRGKQSAIQMVRDFNNWVKGMLIDGYCPQKGAFVFDVCGGRGGDLHKYEKKDIALFVLADNAEVSVREAERRHSASHMKYRGIFICKDCLNEDVCGLLPPDIGFDLVSCQFALHYSFRNEESARGLLRNISARLRPGCFFIGTTVDDREFLERLRRSPTNEFGNSLYQVHNVQFDKANPQCFGSKYTFSLSEAIPDIPEYLVPFDRLVELAKEYNLEFKRKMPFKELYRHFVDKNRNYSISNQDEQWAVCSLYCAFVFQKPFPMKRNLHEMDIVTKSM